ncbi:asparaginase [Roridomyces roridus]|uniref:Asparaginase n=1 Tax=Roridomyces roridus TaxID=1738132 RepID=A0AAD7CEV0_9AGAR|nr:asparaginase [Roridomyces roridus]
MPKLAVHGGAGVHSKNSEAEVKAALRLACTQALSTCGEPSALNLVENAILALEDSPLLNAGYGANLTLDGTVECDAAIMDGCTRDFGSVGAVSGVKNPIRLARAILEHARVPDALGRIPPLTLVSEGAHAFGRLPKTPRAQSQWNTWKARLDGVDAGPVDDMQVLQDTVGAVAWDLSSGTIASGVSSGGILLKYPGRVGEAAVFGAGCWAQEGMACGVSGAGEYIIKASLARSIGQALEQGTDLDVHAILQRVLVEDFWKPSRSLTNPDPSAGVLLLTTEENQDGSPVGRLWCAFTTPSMAIAFVSSESAHPKALILRRPKELESRPNDQPRVFITGFSI